MAMTKRDCNVCSEEPLENIEQLFRNQLQYRIETVQKTVFTTVQKLDVICKVSLEKQNKHTET